ncbi:hypothetical protein PVAP13_2NG111646, partial [Panicum virgatum]
MPLPLPPQMPAMAKELTRRRAAPAGTAEAATATATTTAAAAAATVTGGTRGGRRRCPTLGSSLLGRRLPAQGQRRRGRGPRRPPASCSLQPPLAGWFGLRL